MSFQIRQELLQKLDERRAQLLESVKGLTPEKLERPNREGDRSPKGMLLHLAEAELMYVNAWSRRARDEDEPDLSPPGGRGGGEAPLYGQANAMSLEELLEGIEAARENTIRFVAETADDQWLRVGRNTPFGDLTVHQFLKALYRHDQMHAEEMAGKEGTYVIRTTDGRRL